MGKFIDLTGKKFGRLTVLSKKGYRGPNITWKCRCDCGNTIITKGYYLVNDETKSCGCIKREGLVKRNYKHGFAPRGMPTAEYKIWLGIIKRCYDPSCIVYKYYGGKGIKMCNRWRHSFPNFFSDMGKRPLKKSIDRINGAGDYKPSNCRWATRVEQAKNRTFPNKKK